jgi:ribosome-binding factor A
MSRRTERVNELLRKELSWLLTNEINDPRLPVVVAITTVEVSSDLRNATVFVSVMGDTLEKSATVKILQSAAGFLHRSLKQRVDLRNIPILRFKLDDSINKSARMLKIIEGLHSTKADIHD